MPWGNTLPAFLYVILDLWGEGVGLCDIGVVSCAGGSSGGVVVLSGIALLDGMVQRVTMGGVTLHCGLGFGVLVVGAVVPG